MLRDRRGMNGISQISLTKLSEESGPFLFYSMRSAIQPQPGHNLP